MLCLLGFCFSGLCAFRCVLGICFGFFRFLLSQMCIRDRCRKCGKEIPEGSSFCNICGASQKPPPPRRPKQRGNGTGTVIKLPNGKYKAVVVLEYFRKENGKMGRKLATKTCARKSDAVAALPELRREKPQKREITLQELYDIYTKTTDYISLSHSQQDKLEYAWNRLKPLARRAIDSLTVEEMQDVIDSAVQTYYPARDMKVMLSHCLLYTSRCV